jgi:hypothetical protein
MTKQVRKTMMIVSLLFKRSFSYVEEALGKSKVLVEE